MTDPITRAREKIGRRGVVLVSLGAVWVLYAASIATYVPLPGRTGRFDIAPLDSPLWAILWLACGLFAIGFGVARYRGVDDVPGWIAAVGPPMIWTAMYAISALWSISPDQAMGSHRAWVGLVTWAMLAGLIRTVAGWQDEHRPVQR